MGDHLRLDITRKRFFPIQEDKKSKKFDTVAKMRIIPRINGRVNIALLPLKEVTRIRKIGKTIEIDSTNRSKGNQSPRLKNNATKGLDSHTLGNIKPNRVDV